MSATDAPEVLEIRRGETVSAEMAAGDPDTTFVVFELTSETDEPLTVATDTLHFDTLLEVEETATGRLVGWDDDGGAGTNSRLTLRAESGKTYRVKVGAGLDDWGGPFRLSIAQGEAPAPDWKNDGQASLDYWRAVEAEGNSGGPPVLAARAALGLAAWDRSSQRYEEARSGIEQAHRLFEDLLGAGHLSTAGCTVTLAYLHQDLGDHVGARRLLEEAQEAYSRVLGPRHWLTLNLGLSLATTAGKTEESTQAIALYRSLLGQLEDRLGPKHPLYLEKLSDLAQELFMSGSVKEAREIWEQVVGDYRNWYGAEHERTLITELALADAIYYMGEPARSLELYGELVPRLVKRLGEGHPVCLRKRRVFAHRVWVQGNVSRAREMFEQSLALAEKHHGPESLEAAHLLEGYGLALQKNEANREAVPFHERALAIYRAQDDSTAVADCATDLGEDLHRLGELDRAQELFEEALAINQRYRPDSTDEALGHWYLAILFRDRADTDRALFHFERNRDIWRRRVGPGRGSGTVKNIFKLYVGKGEEEKARKLFAQAVGGTSAEYGADSVEVATEMLVYGKAFCAAGMTNDARAVLEDTHERLRGLLGGSDALTLEALENLGRQCCHDDREDARFYFERMVRVYSTRFGPDHPDTLTARFTLADVLDEVGEGDRAREIYHEWLPVYEEALGSAHDAFLLRFMLQAQAIFDSGQYPEALPLWNRAVELHESKYGPENKDTLDVRFAAADVLYHTGETDAAMRAYENLLPLLERLVGPHHDLFLMRLMFQAGRYRMHGRYQESLAIYERMAALYEARYGRFHSKTLEYHFRAGDVLYDMGEHELAVARYRDHLPSLLETGGIGSNDYLDRLKTQAIRLHRLGHEDEARGLFEDAIRLAEAREEPNSTRMVLGLNGSYLSEVGLFEEALERFRDALAILEVTVGPGHRWVAQNLLNQTRQLNYLGRYEEATPLTERALGIQEQHHGVGSFESADYLLWLGLTLQRSGRPAEAKPFLEQHLEICRRFKGPRHIRTSWALGAYSLLLLDLGAYEEARGNFEEVLTTRERYHGPNAENVAQVLCNLGKTNNLLGDYATALENYDRARRIREQKLGETDHLVAPPLMGMAEAHRGLGNREAARSLLERALAIREQYHEEGSAPLAAVLEQLASLYLEMGFIEKARQLFERAVQVTEDEFGPEHPDLVGRLAGLARTDFLLGAPDDALDTALRAEAIGRAHLRETARAIAENRALTLSATRESALGLAVSIAVETAPENPRAVTEVWDAVIASRAIVLDEVASRHGRIAAVARLAQRSAEAASRLADLTVRGPGDASSAEHENRLRAARLEKERADQALALATAGLEDPRRPTTRGVRGISTVLPIRGALVAYLLYDREFPRPPGERDDSSPIAAVSSYAAFVVRAGLRDPRLVPLGAAADIDAAIDRWRQSIVPGSTWSSAGAALDDSTAGEALRRDVWDPIAAALGDDVERVIVVPDGALNLVNLAALPTGESRYLVESGPLFHYASAERDLYHARRERPSGQGLLALGGASFDETSLFASLRTGSGNTDDVIRVASATAYRGQRSSCADFQSMEFESLPGTVGEIDEIVELWRTVHGIGGDSPGTTDAADGTRFEQLSGAAANETAFKELAPRCRMLHVATHGFFLGGRCASVMEPSRGIGGLAAAPPPAGGSSAVQPTTPEEPSRQEREAEPVVRENPLLLSGLALAGANHRSAAGPDEEDGILTAEEIAALDLSGVEWAVLSACDTGVGDIRAGEGVFGLRRAFQVAGARTLIISLWSVDDESTRAWMTALYDARLGRRLDTAEAAREASLAVLEERRGAGHSTSPFFWAGFVAAGDWR